MMQQYQQPGMQQYQPPGMQQYQPPGMQQYQPPVLQWAVPTNPILINVKPYLPASLSDPILGMPLPSRQLGPGLQLLARFPTVLSVPGPSVTNNHGWVVKFSKNQVEAVTLVVFEACRLVGVGIANPINPGQIAIVESISLYNGNTATGNPIAVHQGREQLQGCYELLTYLYFSRPFALPATTPVTLKVKLVPSNPSVTSIDLYRGNPYERPDLCLGTDGLLWDFEETVKVGVGETIKGNHSKSGPILAFVYQQ